MKSKKAFLLMEALVALFILAAGITVGLRAMSAMTKITRRSFLLSQASFFSRELVLKMETQELDFSKDSEITYTPPGAKSDLSTLKAEGQAEEFEMELEKKEVQAGTPSENPMVPGANTQQAPEQQESNSSNNTYQKVHFQIKRDKEIIVQTNALLRITKSTEDSKDSATASPTP